MNIHIQSAIVTDRILHIDWPRHELHCFTNNVLLIVYEVKKNRDACLPCIDLLSAHSIVNGRRIISIQCHYIPRS
jgi:hypothetical protein